MFNSGQLDRQTNIAHLFVIPFAITYLSLCSFLFLYSHCNLCFFSAFPPSEIHFLPPLPIKEVAVLDWTRKVDFPSNRSSTHFVPLLHRTKPTCCCKTELFVFLPLSSALWLLQCLSFIVNLNPVKFSPCCISLLLISSCLHFTLVLPCLRSTVLPSTLSFFPHVDCSGGKTELSLSILPSVQGLCRSQTSHHRRAELMRGEEILT